MKKGYIKASIYFQGGEDETFNVDYFISNHIPLIRKLLGKAVKKITVERGISGGAPGSMPPYIAVAGIYFENMNVFNQTYDVNAREIMSDFRHFTSSTPILQMSEIVYDT